MSYPSSLSYFVSRLSGVSVNTFRLQPQNATTALPNSVIKVTLPSNSLLSLGDTGGFAMHFKANCTGDGGRLPPDISSLISRVDVSMGGISVSQGCSHYNMLRHMKSNLMGKRCSSSYGHPVICRRVNTMNALTMNAGVNEADNADFPYQFTIDYWDGFLGELDPKILDSSILPDIVVSIYLAGPEVISTSKESTLPKVHDPSSENWYRPVDNTGTISEAGTGASFSLSDIHFTQKVFGLADSVYDNMVAAQIAENSFVEISFKNYYTTSDTHTGSTRFTVATQSLDRVYATFRDKDFATQTAPQYRAGYKFAGGFIAPSTAFTPGTAFDVGLSLFDKGGTGPYDNEGLVNRFFNCTAPRHTTGGAALVNKVIYNTTCQFSLNSSLLPQYAATIFDWESLSKSSVPYYHDNGESQLNWLYNRFVLCQQLNLPGSEGMRLISGLDTRAVSLQGFLQTTNVTGEPNVVIALETTACLRVGAGKMLEVIF
jgi:hypothetical protein